MSLLLDSTMPNLSPETVTSSPINRLCGNEELPSAYLDISNPDAEKLNCFFAFMQEKLKWTFSELLYHLSNKKKVYWICLEPLQLLVHLQ